MNLISFITHFLFKMSSNIPLKTDLDAIHRLEFYKKQKNWKLCQSNKKSPKKRVVKKPDLDCTYNVEDSLKPEKVPDPLNVGNTGGYTFHQLDKVNQPDMPKNQKLLQEWQEPINIWPVITQPDNTSMNTEEHCRDLECANAKMIANNSNSKRNGAMQRLQGLLRVAKLYGETEQLNNAQYILKEFALPPPDIQHSTEVWANNTVDDGGSQWNKQYYDVKDDKWLMQEEVVFDAQYEAQRMWSEAVDQEVIDSQEESGCLDWSDELRECWLVDPGDTNNIFHSIFSSMDLQDTREYVEEFLAGARLAPQSSQLDLAQPPGVAALRRLSAGQLRAALQGAARAQRCLQAEARRRLLQMVRVHAHRTRQSGPPDGMLSGSHLQGAQAGKGRGRLAQGGAPPGAFL